jgi:uncharacterized protein
MRVDLFSRSFLLLFIIVALSLSGCLGRSPSPTFYALTPVQNQYVSQRSSPVKNAIIGIGPVKLPEYLDESLIVTRTGDNELDKAQFHRWVGSFKDNFTNVLADDLGSLLATERVYLYPWRLSVPIDYQVTVDVIRCDGRLGDAAWLEARWSIFKGPEKKLLKIQRSTIREPVTGPGYADLVAAQSRAVAQLSQEITMGIQGTGKR